MLKGAVELTLKTVAILAIVVVAGWALLAPASFESITGIKIGQYVGQDTDTTATQTTDTTTDTITDTTTSPQVMIPSYQVGRVNAYLKDKLNPKSGIPGVEIEVLDSPAAPYTYSDLAGVAADPMRDVVDEDTSTSSAGLANFTANKIFINQPYLYSLRGDSTTYDKLIVRTIPVPSTEFAISQYTFSDKVFGYYVGGFSALYFNGTELNYTKDTQMNITGKSGLTYVTFDITIGQSQSGNATKDSVLVLRSPENYELEPGDIVSLYIIRKDGTAFNIPGVNLADYIDGPAIDLGGSIYDEDYRTYMMSVADSGTYTVKLTYDPTLITPGSDRLVITVDDLGGWRARDDVTRDVKATAAELTLVWTA